MVNYQLGRLYKMVNKITNEFYVGSTTVKYLSQRKSGHAHDSARIELKSPLMTAIRAHGIANFDIVLIENFPCNSKEELLARERYQIEQLKPTYNVHVPIILKEERKEYQAKHAAKYNKTHPEERKATVKRSYEKNKEKNREKVSEYGRQKVQCECGSISTKRGWAAHLKSTRHYIWTQREGEPLVPGWLFSD